MRNFAIIQLQFRSVAGGLSELRIPAKSVVKSVHHLIDKSLLLSPDQGVHRLGLLPEQLAEDLREGRERPMCPGSPP
jgi:hypothetical protein